MRCEVKEFNPAPCSGFFCSSWVTEVSWYVVKMVTRLQSFRTYLQLGNCGEVAVAANTRELEDSMG